MAEEFENTSQDTQADVKGAGTMLAAPFEIARQDTLLEVQKTVNQTDTTIGDIGDPAGEESLVGLIKDIPEKVPTGAVKSVQKGIITAVPNTGVSGKLYEIPINTVDPNKCLVVLNSGLLSNGSSLGGDSLILTDLSANILKVTVFTTNTGGSASFCWQVIEFF
ncbi:hypothetical protein [Anaerotignum lactatifermentans]|uniref:hypothetical protein n=1 Tax=Anaerotignum lactatifermentans TaxID=160404 RepID=UPI002676BF32|nr:hypothetical protein [Anaerotignum lactatifermentans]